MKQITDEDRKIIKGLSFHAIKLDTGDEVKLVTKKEFKRITKECFSVSKELIGLFNKVFSEKNQDMTTWHQEDNKIYIPRGVRVYILPIPERFLDDLSKTQKLTSAEGSRSQKKAKSGH